MSTIKLTDDELRAWDRYVAAFAGRAVQQNPAQAAQLADELIVERRKRKKP
jgi:hypothetical protein